MMLVHFLGLDLFRAGVGPQAPREEGRRQAEFLEEWR
jgi:hypothetical protein